MKFKKIRQTPPVVYAIHVSHPETGESFGFVGRNRRRGRRNRTFSTPALWAVQGQAERVARQCQGVLGDCIVVEREIVALDTEVALRRLYTEALKLPLQKTSDELLDAIVEAENVLLEED